jgi:LacI family transcriptional regulator
LTTSNQDYSQESADLSLVGFHDAPFTSYFDPALTTVRMPLLDMGRQAAANLLALMNGETVDDVMVGTPPALVVRASAGP